MPSRAERRRALELGLRGLGLAALGLLLVGAVRGGSRGARPARIELRVESALPGWTVAPPAETLAVRFDTVPSQPVRAWLSALRDAGTDIRWTAPDIPPVAIEAERRGAPDAGAIVRVAAPAGSAVVLEDSLGTLDSATAGTGAAFAVTPPAGLVRARVGRHAAVTDAGLVAARAVVVLGRGGWETRFVIRALEEQGWTVDARLALGADRYVVQGTPLPLDTARHAAVVLLDSVSAAVTAQVVGFVRRGGGLALGARRSALGTRHIAPAAFGEMAGPSELTFTSTAPRAALAYRPLVALRDDAVILERRDGRVVVAARRERAGRVVQVGYEETWRWRMTGGDDAPAAHAAWWSGVVAAAAYRPADRRVDGPADRVDAAPYASLVEALGPPADALPDGAGPVPQPSFTWLLALAIACFLAEWTSRRLRGES